MTYEIPEISIIIPMYNAERYIDQTLMSIQQQTFTNFELFIIDDCSTDKSVQIVKEFQQTDELRDKLKLIQLQKNGGISSTRNVGLRMSRGNYITFVDNDDFLVPNALETMIAMARKYNAEVVHTHSHYQNRSEIDENATVMDFLPSTFEVKSNTKSPPHLLTNDLSERVDDFTDHKIDWNVWSKLFKRDFLMLNDIKFPKIPYTEDMMFCIQCLLSAKRYVMIPDLVYVYRVRSSSTIHRERNKNFLKKIIDTQIIGLRMISEYMNNVEYFADHERDRERMINFYMKLELLSSRAMQRKYLKGLTYYRELQTMYEEHFGKDKSWIAYMHMLANR